MIYITGRSKYLSFHHHHQQSSLREIKKENNGKKITLHKHHKERKKSKQTQTYIQDILKWVKKIFFFFFLCVLQIFNFYAIYTTNALKLKSKLSFFSFFFYSLCFLKLIDWMNNNNIYTPIYSIFTLP